MAPARTSCEKFKREIHTGPLHGKMSSNRGMLVFLEIESFFFFLTKRTSILTTDTEFARSRLLSWNASAYEY